MPEAERGHVGHAQPAHCKRDIADRIRTSVAVGLRIRRIADANAVENDKDDLVDFSHTCRVSRHREQNKTAESHDIVNKIKR